MLPLGRDMCCLFANCCKVLTYGFIPADSVWSVEHIESI